MNNKLIVHRPRFNANGDYIVRTNKDAIEAAVSTLRFLAVCPQVYHSQGPEAIIKNMLEAIQSFLKHVEPV